MIENDEKVKLQPKKVITCPHCKWTYLPGEILYGDNVVGVPTQIVRDALGHVIYEEYKKDCEPLAEEKYYCDNCGKPFIVEYELSVKTKPEEQMLDFTDLTTKLF